MEARARAAVARLQELQQQPPSAPAAEQRRCSKRRRGRNGDDQSHVAARPAHGRHDDRRGRARGRTRSSRRPRPSRAKPVRPSGCASKVRSRRCWPAATSSSPTSTNSTSSWRLSVNGSRPSPTDLNDITTRVGNGLGPMRQPQLSASNTDHSGEVAAPAEGSLEPNDGEEEADVAELIDQVSSTDVAESAVDDARGQPLAVHHRRTTPVSARPGLGPPTLAVDNRPRRAGRRPRSV